MKLAVSIILVSIALFASAQTHEMYNGDTINVRDAENKKQGLWIEFSSSNKVSEKGNYINNKKEGVWLAYYSNGKLKHEITYANSRPDGPATFYYEDGKVSEKGIWKVNKWVGEYKYYHTNGNLAYDWSYNQSGKRTGVQKYYYADGSMMYNGDWNNGKKEGRLTEFYPDGSIKSEMDFNEGKLNTSSIKEYTIAEKPAKKQLAPNLSTKNLSEDEKQSYGLFTKTGYYKTFNEHKKIDREGEFLKGKLMDGKRYFYNDNGELTKTLVYEAGKVVQVIDTTLQN